MSATSAWAWRRPWPSGQRAGELLLTMGEIEPIESVVEKLRAVTPDDILRVARRIIQGAKPALAVVGPNVNGDDLAGLLDG